MNFIDVNIKDHEHNPVKINVNCILSVQAGGGNALIVTTGITYYNGSPSSLVYTLDHSKSEVSQMIDAIVQRDLEFQEVSSRFMDRITDIVNKLTFRRKK